MKATFLLDHDVEGVVKYLEARLRETGWNRDLTVEFLLLRDLDLPDDYDDRDIWLFTQRHRVLLITSNRNKDDETSLEATIERENTPHSLPVITLSQPGRLAIPDYREQAAHKLAEIIIYLENYLGVGRVYIP